MLTDGKLEEARFILEDMAFQSPDDPNVVFDMEMDYSGSDILSYFSKNPETSD